MPLLSVTVRLVCNGSTVPRRARTQNFERYDRSLVTILGKFERSDRSFARNLDRHRTL